MVHVYYICMYYIMWHILNLCLTEQWINCSCVDAFPVVLFGMYADDSYSYVQKEEMDRLVLESEGQVSSALSDLFQEVIVCEVLNIKH